MTRHADTKTATIEGTAQIEAGPPKRKRATKRELARRDLRLLEQLAAGATIGNRGEPGDIAAPRAETQGGDSHPARHRPAPRVHPAADPPPERGDARRLL